MTKKTLVEVLMVTVCNFIMGIVMVLVFAVLGYFSLPVLWGALLGNAFVSVSFLCLGYAVERAVAKNPSNAQARIGATYTLRLLAAAAMIIFAIKSPFINVIAAVLPLFYQRISILAVGFIENKRKGRSA